MQSPSLDSDVFLAFFDRSVENMLLQRVVISARRAQEFRDISRPIGLPGDLCQHKPADQEQPKDYPVADFLDPIEYTWSEAQYEAQSAAKRYLEDSHADY